MMEHKKHNIITGVMCLFIVLTIGLVGFLWYGYKKYDLLRRDNLATTSELDQTQKNLQSLTEANNYILATLNQEKNKNTAFEDQINEITKTVGDLDKLSKTDKELLQKYSKVYFLNENYIPEALSDIP